MTQVSFGTIEFRNGIYQGFKTPQQPEGPGLFMDDNLVLHCSTWKAGQLNNHTAVLLSHGKYVYGEWKDGLPHGFNVFRSGDTVLLGNFKEGKIERQFIIIFERQDFTVIASPSGNGFSVSEKREFKSQEDLKQVITNALDYYTLQEEYFSFVGYLHASFCAQGAPLKLQVDEGLYRFGFENGLGAVFDDDNFINKLGCIDERDQVCGLGVLYSKLTEVGNFGSGVVIKYRPNHSPVADVKTLLKNEHKRSIYFRNDFMLTRTADIIQSLEDILKRVITTISANPLDTQRSITCEELNQSLEYRQKTFTPSQQNQRLKMIRRELHRSIGLPVNIKPSASEAKIMSRYPQQMKQLHFQRVDQPECIEPDSISFAHKGKPLKESRRQFIKENRLQDYRVDARQKAISNFQISKSSKTINRYSQRQDKGSMNQSRSQIQKSPNRKQSYKELEMSTAHRQKVPQEYQPVDNFNPKDYHTNKRAEELIERINNPLEDHLQSPLRRYTFNESMMQSTRKVDCGSNNCSQYIPVSHNNVAKPAARSPQRHKQSQQVKASPPKQFKQLDRSARSYLALYKNSSPEKQGEKEQTKPSSQNSPSKNPHYQKQPSVPVVYSKQPTKLANPQVKQRQKMQESRESPLSRSKMVEEICKKYNYVRQSR